MGVDFFAVLKADPDAAVWLDGWLGQSIRMRIDSAEPLNSTLLCSGDLPSVMPRTVEKGGGVFLRVDGEKGHFRISVLIAAVHLDRQTMRLTIQGEPTELPRRKHFRLNNPGVQTGVRPKKDGEDRTPYTATKTRNISEGGAAVLVPHGKYAVGDQMEVKMTLGDGYVFTTPAKIVNIPPKSGEIGHTLLCLEFQELPKPVASRIARYIVQKTQSRRTLA